MSEVILLLIFLFFHESFLSLSQFKLVASDATANDNFGWGNAIYGDTAVIGAVYADGAVAVASGAAYIYNRTSGNNWVEVQKIWNSDGVAGDIFGYAIDIQGDYLIVGATYDDLPGDSGAAYVFHRSGGVWTEQAKLKASNAQTNDYFGHSVSLNGPTADWAIIGTFQGGTKTGTAYIFNRTGTTWVEHAILTASDAGMSDHFGKSVSVSGDYAIVGSYGHEDAGVDTGAAYIFKREAGNVWNEKVRLTASNPSDIAQFGLSVNIEGEFVAVGAPGAGGQRGSVYIFKRNGTYWIEEEILWPKNAPVAYFGFSVSLSGNFLLVGAYLDDPLGVTDAGQAYLYYRHGDYNWTLQAKINSSDADVQDYFGSVVSLNNNYALVGAYHNDDAGSDSGSGLGTVKTLLLTSKKAYIYYVGCSSDCGKSQGRGDCGTGFTCKCFSGWGGTECQDFQCDNPVCDSIHAECLGSNNCVCKANWTSAPDCDIPVCPQDCGSKGTCTEGINGNYCSCDGNFAGDTCNLCKNYFKGTNCDECSDAFDANCENCLDSKLKPEDDCKKGNDDDDLTTLFTSQSFIFGIAGAVVLGIILLAICCAIIIICLISVIVLSKMKKKGGKKKNDDEELKEDLQLDDEEIDLLVTK